MPRLSPSASRRAWPSASARVLDGVVLVDFQVAGAPELERKPAVTRHLLEHVIEERDSRCDSHRRRAIEIDCDLDRGLAGPAVDPGRAWRPHQPPRDRFPGFLVAALATDAQPD